MTNVHYELFYLDNDGTYIASAVIDWVRVPDLDWCDTDPVIALQMCRTKTRHYLEGRA